MIGQETPACGGYPGGLATPVLDCTRQMRGAAVPGLRTFLSPISLTGQLPNSPVAGLAAVMRHRHDLDEVSAHGINNAERKLVHREATVPAVDSRPP